MLASVFIVSGYDALRHPQKRAEIAEPFVESTVGVLPDEVTSVIPTDPVTLVRVNGGIQLASGVLLATGKFPRFASAVLAGSLAPTTFAGHPFWEESDPVARSMQRTHFLKNLSLMGGLLISAADTEGKPSLAWRGRRKADAALAALPLGAKASTTAWDSIREHAQDSASTLGEKSSEAAGLLKQDAHKLGERSAEAAEMAWQAEDVPPVPEHIHVEDAEPQERRRRGREFLNQLRAGRTAHARDGAGTASQFREVGVRTSITVSEHEPVSSAVPEKKQSNSVLAAWRAHRVDQRREDAVLAGEAQSVMTTLRDVTVTVRSGKSMREADEVHSHQRADKGLASVVPGVFAHPLTLTPMSRPGATSDRGATVEGPANPAPEKRQAPDGPGL